MFGRLFKRNLAMLLVTTIAGIVLSFAAVISISLTTSIYYPIEMWLHAQDLFTLLYPLLCTIPFCWEICSERKNGFLKYVPNRAPLGRYLLYRYLGALIAIFCYDFFVLFPKCGFCRKNHFSGISNPVWINNWLKTLGRYFSTSATGLCVFLVFVENGSCRSIF